jgi:hypothetical protein
MATNSNYALRLPPSVMEELKKRAEQEKISINQFIFMAVVEKLTAMRTRDYFVRRAARAAPGDFERILAKAGAEPPMPGDEPPEEWLEEASAGATPSSHRGGRG